MRNPDHLSRRDFVRTTAVAATAVSLAPWLRADGAAKQVPFTSLGIAAPLDQAVALKEAGAEFLVESVGGFLVPDKGDDVFSRNLEKLQKSPLPVVACNSFIRPPHLRCVGADATHDLVLEWANTVFKRMHQAGGRMIVFGSGGSRQLRDGWPKEKADEQFVSLLKRMGPLAKEQGITVVLEQLQERECNYINRIREGAAIVRAAGHPHIRLLADFYHMTNMGDTAADLESAMDVVVHVEIAEKAQRTVPGVAGENFRPFLRVLKERGYRGAISIEGKWEIAQIAPAFREIRKQAAEA